MRMETTTHLAETPETDILVITTAERNFLFVYLALTTTLSCLLNASVLLTLINSATLRQNPLYTLLTCQLVCDLVLPSVYIPVAVILIASGSEEKIHLDDRLVVLQSALLQGLGLLLPLHILTLITMERYLYICKPLRYGTFVTARNVGRSLMAIAVIMSLTVVASSLVYETVQTGLACRFKIGLSNRSLTGFLGLFYVCVPLLSQGACFVGITRAVLKQRRMIQDITVFGVNLSGLPHHTMQTQTTVLKSVLGVIRMCGIYWMTWFPAFVVYSIQASLRERDMPISFAIQMGTRYSFLVVMTIIPIVDPLFCLRSLSDLRKKWFKMTRIGLIFTAKITTFENMSGNERHYSSNI